MFHSALICTDFSDGLDRLTERITDLVQGGLSRIVFFHSVPLWTEGNIPRIDKEKVAAAQTQLSKALIQVPPGVDVKVEVVSGNALDNIPQVIERYQCDVILMGTPIKSLLQEKMFGSTSMGLMKSKKKPVMILRPQVVSTYTREELALRCQHLWRYLLLPYNGSDEAKYLVKQIKNLVQEAPEGAIACCLLLSVLDDGGVQRMQIDYLQREAETNLAAVKAELESIGLQVQTAVKIGNPLTETLKVAAQEDISAIAIASKPRNQLLELTVHSYASDLLHRSWFPTLFFPI
ncbi:universal stress protein family domain protein [[Synechococcus] sp. NIES-970]|uniref:universal stress protein n=1 Tax=Picosynechococcus sp. NKBG15041c TaxID=1407650 RepID=UPI00041DCAC9|nr:universal stress protein [Picosynechococcus sp. NKBG15041c]BAW97281.1 universal stress protein family domain protein [[Synechococcus] sp. NIES-970]